MSAEFRKLVADHWTGAPQETAARILLALKVNKQAATILLQVVTDAVRDEMRGGTRRVEQSVNVAQLQDEPTARRARFLSERFVLEDGRFVTWGEASEADHLARIALLAKLRDGIDATIQRHELALKVITDHGVTCLNDLPADEVSELAA